MLLRCLPLFFAVLALLALTAEARPTRGTLLSRQLTIEERGLTNAERLKRGLPPRAPAIGRILPGRAPTAASKYARRSASPSPSPSVITKTFTGRIQVRQANKTSVGFVNNTDTGFLTVDVEKAGTDLRVKIATTASGGPFSLIATNQAWVGSPFVGGGTNDTLAAGSVAVVPIANVPQTSAHAPPTANGASAIWTVDAKTLQLKPHWTNLNDSVAKTTIGYDFQANLLFLTGDIAAYNSLNNNTAEAVKFFLVK